MSCKGLLKEYAPKAVDHLWYYVSEVMDNYNKIFLEQIEFYMQFQGYTNWWNI